MISSLSPDKVGGIYFLHCYCICLSILNHISVPIVHFDAFLVKKVIIKILNLANRESLFDLFSVCLKTIEYLNLILFICCWDTSFKI